MKLRKVLSHINIVLAGMIIVFFCIDRVNTAMNFMTSQMSRWLIFFFSLTALGEAIAVLISIRRTEVRQRLRQKDDQTAGKE